MSHRFAIKPLAEQDIAEIYAWYNERQAGLGDDFLGQLETSLYSIQTNPNHYQVRYKQIRMVKIKRFPICLHYSIAQETVFVHAVLSTHRNPRIWKKRS